MPITGMALASGLEPYAPADALVLFGVWFSIAVLFGGWITGQWIVTHLEADTVHPGYFLPTVAGSFVAADSAAHLGMIGLGWVSFGIGLISWFTMGAIIMNRLMLRPSLPPALTPTLAIQVAPAVVAGNAYFALTGGRVDMGAYLLAGYAVLMVLVQLRLAPIYLMAPFAPSFWTFTFSYAAVTANALRWIDIKQISGGMMLGYLLLAAITALIGGIAIRSVIALRHGRFLPTHAT
jgi:tellurite resistance protein